MYGDKNELDGPGHHPIDIAQSMGASCKWAFQRLDDDQIIFHMDGVWQSYEVAVYWSAREQQLRVCSMMQLTVSDQTYSVLLELLNVMNDTLWNGNFSYSRKDNALLFRSGLTMSAYQSVTSDQIQRMINVTVEVSERYYPSLQMVIWGGANADEALALAMNTPFGHA